jgi:hypothetical protein
VLQPGAPMEQAVDLRNREWFQVAFEVLGFVPRRVLLKLEAYFDYR